MPTFPSLPPPPRKEGLPLPIVFILLPGTASSSVPFLGRGASLSDLGSVPHCQQWYWAEKDLPPPPLGGPDSQGQWAGVL